MCPEETAVERRDITANSCFVGDESGPLRIGIQVQILNRRRVLRSKVVVLSAIGKGQTIGQVRAMKLNESEELTKRRYDKVQSKPEVLSGHWDKSGRNLVTGQTAVGVEVTGAWHRLLQGTGEI